MTTVFIVNGFINDFYIALYFLATTQIGVIYFYMNPYLDPRMQQPISENSQILESKLRNIQINIRKEIYDKIYGTAYRFSYFLTTVIFVNVVTLWLNSSIVTEDLQVIVVDNQFNPTSIGVASILMILNNYILWIEFTQHLSYSPQFKNIDNVMDRARLLVTLMTEVSEFCTTLKQVSNSTIIK